jgi:hypothetical protein
MFLENEIWVWCPVKSSFSMMKLHEFKFLRNSRLSNIHIKHQQQQQHEKNVGSIAIGTKLFIEINLNFYN